MSFVDLHPHFVSARNYEDVKTIVGWLKDPIDDDDFERPGDAPYLPPSYTSTIHITDSLSGLASTYNSVSVEPSLRRQEKAAKSSAHLADDSHEPFGENTSNTARFPPDSEIDSISGLPLSNVPKPPALSASMTKFKMRHRTSSYHRHISHPKILCVWDVDDTLVATGVSGVRQNLVFRESELVSLFRSAGPETRHLLLSQGSIDDVFEKSGGRLRCIQKFFQRVPSSSKRNSLASSTSSVHSAPLRTGKGKKSLFGDLLRCGTGRQTKEQPSFGIPYMKSDRSLRSVDEGTGGTNERDMRHLSPGTVVVRLSSVHSRGEGPADAAFLTDAAKQPTCGGSSTTPLDDKAECMGRWLILRPEVWGITLASMNTIIPPSRNTAFVNGKVYRKMDVVWSLAMTGEWDSVFFIDNNLSEVGVVRYGMQMSDVLNLRSGCEVWRFFQSDFLLLTAAANLREMEQRYGRDVTKPPPKSKEESNMKRMNNAAKTKDGVESMMGSSGELHTKSTDMVEGGELTPSKSTATSSSDGALQGNADRAGGKLFRGRDPSEVNRREAVHVDVGEDIQILERQASASRRVLGSAANGSRHCADSLSLSSPLVQPPNAASPRFAAVPMPSNRDVDFVVVNLHMSCSAFRRVLTTARTNNDGQCALRREGSLPQRYVGQPLFFGDRSCTDEQYDAIMKYFQETESGLFQWLEEEIRMKNYVDFGAYKKWIPAVHTVHAPIRKRPTYIPHMPMYYTTFFDTVEEKVAKVLQKHGGTSASITLHSEAQRQYFVLQRILPFVDPYLTGDLGRILFDIYIVDGNIPRSLADHLQKALNNVRERIVLMVKHK